MTALADRLVRQIRVEGPITVADFMAACFADPEHGYYMAREPFGAGGDFVTAPEVSQVFGELIGLWAVAVHEAMGAPSPFLFAELGPGRGTLMADALRAARLRPRFGEAARVVLVETSPRLRRLQAERLAGTGVEWVDIVDALPRLPAIVIANEFFDALPVRQFVMTERGWAERMVGIGDDGRLAFGLRPAPEAALPAAPSGSIREIAPAAAAIAATIGERLASNGGAALIIDYGYDRPGFGDTLQAVRRHAYADPLAEPGEADLTTHVDFAALVAAAEETGARPRAIIGQGDFLRALGIAERAAILASGKDGATRTAIAAAVERLTAPAAMGTLFRVLALSGPGLALPVFDPPRP